MRARRRAGDDAHGRGPALGRVGVQLVVGQRVAGAEPQAPERRVERRDRGPAHPHHRVAPRLAAARRVARPLVPDAQAAGHRRAAVGDEQLAVVALQDLERVQGQQRMECPHRDARLAQAAPEAVRGPDRAERVVEHAHAHLRGGALGEDLGEASAGMVVADDVVLEVDPAPRRGDVGEHRGEGDGAVGMVVERVAGDGARARRAIDREAERVAHPAGAPAPPRPRTASTGRSA